MGALIARKRTRLGRRGRSSQACARLRLFLHLTCFSCAAMVFRYLTRARTFFTKYVPWRSFRSHVTWNSAVPDPNAWCCILLFLCTLGCRQCHRIISVPFSPFFFTEGQRGMGKKRESERRKGHFDSSGGRAPAALAEGLKLQIQAGGINAFLPFY